MLELYGQLQLFVLLKATKMATALAGSADRAGASPRYKVWGNHW